VSATADGERYGETNSHTQSVFSLGSKPRSASWFWNFCVSKSTDTYVTLGLVIPAVLSLESFADCVPGASTSKTFVSRIAAVIRYALVS